MFVCLKWNEDLENRLEMTSVASASSDCGQSLHHPAPSQPQLCVDRCDRRDRRELCRAIRLRSVPASDALLLTYVLTLILSHIYVYSFSIAESFAGDNNGALIRGASRAQSDCSEMVFVAANARRYHQCLVISMIHDYLLDARHKYIVIGHG